MKHIIFIILAFLSTMANAWEWEASFGQVQYTRHAKETGNWAQPGPSSQGFRDQVEMTPIGYTLGATGRLAPSWKWRAGYANLGKTSSIATATKWDMDFDFTGNVCTRNCDALTTFVGSADVQGLYATAVREFKVGSYKLFIEGGAWVYRNKFALWVYNPVGTAAPYFPGESYGLGDLEIKNKWSAGPVLGVGIGKGNTSFALTAYTVRHSGGPVPSINDGKPYAVMASFRMEF